ncbi:RNA/RNP complex-1-interacting phosphatase-like isoform X2 [Prorops nasuta]
MLLKEFPRLKCIVDLTNTTRYYNPVEITKAGLTYHKLMIPGKQLPPEHHVKQFFKIVETFLSSHRGDDIIGVHCTHGLNRTGYLICRYLIQQLNWDPEDAIKAFGAARGYEIERKEYTDKLRKTTRGQKIDLSNMSISRPPTNWRYDGRQTGRPSYEPRPPVYRPPFDPSIFRSRLPSAPLGPPVHGVLPPHPALGPLPPPGRPMCMGPRPFRYNHPPLMRPGLVPPPVRPPPAFAPSRFAPRPFPVYGREDFTVDSFEENLSQNRRGHVKTGYTKNHYRGRKG